jgi:hypothetical protein
MSCAYILRLAVLRLVVLRPVVIRPVPYALSSYVLFFTILPLEQRTVFFKLYVVLEFCS